MTFTVAVVASHECPFTDAMLHRLTEIVRGSGPVSEVLLRGRLTGPPAPFEQELASLCDHLGLPVRWVVSQPGGRASVLRRDYDLAHASDLVLAFFPADSGMVGGTSHVVEAALNHGIPVVAYGVSGTGEVHWIGQVTDGWLATV